MALSACQRNGLARHPGQGSPSQHGDVAFAFERRPKVAESVALDLIPALVELRTMIACTAGRNAAFGVGQSVGRVLAAARSGNGHWRDAAAAQRVPPIGRSDFGGSEPLADEGHIGGAADGRLGLAQGLIGQNDRRRL